MSTETLIIEKRFLIEIYKGAPKAMKKKMEQKFLKETFIEPPGLITTWEQACKVLKIHPKNLFLSSNLPTSVRK